MRDIAVEKISKCFGEKKVLTDFSAVFPSGRYTCIMGESGSGKTTLLRILMGLERPDSGTVSGNDVKLSMVFQEDRLCEEFSVASNIRMVTDESVTDAQIRELLSDLALDEDIDSPVSKLSGGMKRRVAVARAIIYGGEWLILDEPFKGMDENTVSKVAAAIKKHFSSVVMVSHSMQEAEMMQADIIYV